MKVTLKKKLADDWSRVDLYHNCNHYVGPYLKRSGKEYQGDFSEIDRERFEKELGVDLSPKSDFWTTHCIKIDSKNNVVFDTTNVKDEFDVKYLENHKRVAVGYSDKSPGTEYVLIKEQDEAEVVNKKAQVKIRSITEYGKLTPEQMRKALRLYGHNPNNVTNEVVQSTLFQLIENDPKKFITLWVENANKDIHFLIEEAVANNVIRNNKTIYKYGTDIIGYTLEEAIDYLKDARNGNVRLAILTQIEGKKEIEAPSEDRTVKSQFSKLLDEIKEDEGTEKSDTEESGDDKPVEQAPDEDKKPAKKVSTSTKKTK